MKRCLFGALAVISILAAQEYQNYKAPKGAAGKWAAPNKPIHRIAELQKKHAGHADWSEVIVDDEMLHAEYISSAPGSTVSKRFHPDTRAWWVVMDGDIRFEIENQQPFVAHKGSIVQVPKQTMFSFETTGNTPSLRFEVNVTGATTLYPDSAEPPKTPKFDFVTIKMTRVPAAYGADNKPMVTFDELASAPKYTRGLYVKSVVTDDRANSSFIYGLEKNLPPENPDSRGHYHSSCAEFWVIMAGQIQYDIETQKRFVADVGDVVYVPPYTYHAPRFHGDAPSCRLAMNGYIGIAHLWDIGRH